MSNVIVASFTDRVRADAALRSLHEDGFRHTWLAAIQPVAANSVGGAGGTVGAGRETVRELEGGNPLRRWFRGDADQTLYDALRDHGVSDDDAQRIDGTVTEGNCVLVVEGANDPRCAEEIVLAASGEVIAAPEPMRTEPGGIDDPMADARVVAAQRHGTGVDAERTALRERRMAIVPVVREDVFIDRVPTHPDAPRLI